MAREKLDLPEKFLFRTELPVRVSDINYGKHLGNDALLSLIHEARLQFLIHCGFKESDIGGAGIIMADCVIVYLTQAFYRGILAIDVTVADLNKYGFDLLYRVTNVKTGKEMARVKTGILCFDYTRNRVTSVPQAFKDVVN